MKGLGRAGVTTVATLVASLGLLVGAGCGGRSSAVPIDAVPSCIPGEEIACACINGATGAQSCTANGTFEECSCAGPTLSGTGNTGSSSGGANNVGPGLGSGNTGNFTSTGGASGGAAAGGATGGSGSTAASGTVVASGSQSLIDLFVTDAGLLLVFSDEVRLVSRAGATLQSVSAAREITAAAFDGTLLVAADKAKFTTYDVNLKQLASANLAVTCSSGVLMDNNRFVCGQNVDWDRVFYTYDALQGTLIASSNMYIYDGIPMKRVPGTSQFVAVETSSEPANLFLFDTGSSGEATFLGSGPFEISDPSAVYAFSGNPATQLIVDDGTMLTIDVSKCSQNSIDGGCFSQNGALGTLTGSQRFIGMDSDLNGNVYALIDPSPSYDGVCMSSCLVEQIDVTTRTVTSQALYPMSSASGIVNVRNDPTGKALVVGYATGNDVFDTDPANVGYGVAVLPY